MRYLPLVLALSGCTNPAAVYDSARALRAAIIETCGHTQAKGTPECDRLTDAYNRLQEMLP